jgi:hypothetical protein
MTFPLATAVTLLPAWLASMWPVPPTDLCLLLIWSQMSRWFVHLNLVIRRIPLLNPSSGKTGCVKRITMPVALLLPRWPAIPLVSKVWICFDISGSLLIVMCSGHARDLCPHQSFLSRVPFPLRVWGRSPSSSPSLACE